MTLQERQQKRYESWRLLSQVLQMLPELLVLDCGLWFKNITFAPLFMYGCWRKIQKKRFWAIVARTVKSSRAQKNWENVNLLYYYNWLILQQLINMDIEEEWRSQTHHELLQIYIFSYLIILNKGIVHKFVSM